MVLIYSINLAIEILSSSNAILVKAKYNISPKFKVKFLVIIKIYSYHIRDIQLLRYHKMSEIWTPVLPHSLRLKYTRFCNF